MKRILTVFIALALIGIHSPAFAGGWDGSGWENPKWSDGAWAGEATTNLSVAKSIPGLTFFADYAEDTLTAGYASGSDVATFAASRSASNPATYIDADGVLQLTTTSNVGRFTKGYYDTTGFHSREGVLIEGAATNYLTDTMFGRAIGADNWDSSYGTITDTSSTIINISGAKERKVEYIYLGSEANFTDFLTQLTPNDSFDASGANVIGTVSFWARGDISGITTGTSTTTFLNISENDNAASFQRTALTKTLAEAASFLSVTEWRRFSFPFTVTDTDTRKVRVSFISLTTTNKPTASENASLEITGVQVEVTPYATSFIPTTAAALTRNLEILKGENDDNRTAATEAMVCKLTPEFPHSSGVNHYMTSTDTKLRAFWFGTSNDVYHRPNATDSSDCFLTDIINGSWAAYTQMTLGFNDQTGVTPYAAGFYQGVADGTNDSTDDFTANAWGTYFYVGSSNSSNNQLGGIIQWIGFWNRPLTATEHLKIYTDMD